MKNNSQNARSNIRIEIKEDGRVIGLFTNDETKDLYTIPREVFADISKFTQESKKSAQSNNESDQLPLDLLKPNVGRADNILENYIKEPEVDVLEELFEMQNKMTEARA